MANARTSTPTNLVNPIPINTEDPVFAKVVLSFSYWVPFNLNIEIQTCAVNSTASPTQVIKLTTSNKLNAY